MIKSKGLKNGLTKGPGTTKRRCPKAGRNCGAMTVEAALVLPAVLCAFFTIIFIIKAVYTYGLIQDALNETASEIASSGYIYQVSGLKDLNDTVRDGLNEKAELMKGQMDSVFDTYSSLKDAGKRMSQDTPDPIRANDSLKNAEQNFKNMLEKAKDASDSPIEELKSIACYIASGTFTDAKTQLFIPVVRFTMKKYLVTQNSPDADQRLRMLDVSGGLAGLDFSESTFLADADENIDIIVKYRVKIPLPVRFSPGFDFRQRVKVKAWIGGDDPSDILKGTASTDNIWSLNNFQRGLKIRKQFHANLPSNFPVIAFFDSGKAVMIKSMDMTAVSYQTGDHAEKQLTSYLNELARFSGLEKPWGSSGVAINSGDIRTKELLLVIPQNKLSDANERLLVRMAATARSKGITLVVERYGLKETENEAENGGTGENGSDTD